MHSNHTQTHTNTQSDLFVCGYRLSVGKTLRFILANLLAKRKRERERDRPAGKISSVVLPDCARLTHIVVDNESIKLLERERKMREVEVCGGRALHINKCQLALHNVKVKQQLINCLIMRANDDSSARPKKELELELRERAD